MPLSLSPRKDLFRFHFPKTFLPPSVERKWRDILQQEPGVTMSPIDFLNESIQAISIPGVSDINIQQTQHSFNRIHRDDTPNAGGHNLGRINVEPVQNNNYISPSNPLANIERKFTVTLRTSVGLYNYFMLYETLFYRISKPILHEDIDTWEIWMMDDRMRRAGGIRLEQCMMDGISGMEFNYTQTDRQGETFGVDFVFNNINYIFLNDDEHK